MTDAYARPELLAETDWLAEHLADPNLRIVDLRYYFDGRDGRAAYAQGHLPGAVYCDWTTDLSDLTAAVANLLPTPEQVARNLGRLGIGDDTLVVGYDDEGGHFAARLWFVLAYYGHDRMKILHGGIQKWVAEGRPLTREVPTPPPAIFTPKSPRETMRIRVDELARRLDDPTLAIADVRRRSEFVGAEVRAKRGGRIPGARHVFWQENLRPDRTFRPADEIRQRHIEAGITPDKEIVTYCQGGVRAAHALFALTLAGFPNVRLYDGSWAEWGNRLDLPIESGEAD